MSRGSWFPLELRILPRVPTSATKSYTSILRLGLTMGDTPDGRYYHLGTRGSSSALQVRPTLPRSGDLPRPRYEIGCWPEDLCSDRECSRGQCHIYQNPAQIRLSLLENSRDDTSFLN
ncbi:RNA polymerase II C-terminal domain phosphatase-like 1 [Dorcoceras hygrometricum]|uniref:RNA polymerase II C-terminal domain phosphatase-like 1 n=1 Tax=Dorcoceras hygrometricum TaxID=472368 RepID=A0A2Z7DDR3_9LAMI|nr:RNA polymerase II C-terminal domain phosphatase-like 1 [Dorcoceras hygrometricum]